MTWSNLSKMLLTKIPVVMQMVETFRGDQKGEAKAKEVIEIVAEDLKTYKLPSGTPILGVPKVKLALDVFMAAGVALANAAAEAEAETGPGEVAGTPTPAAIPFTPVKAVNQG